MPGGNDHRARAGFTLIELILVMALLVIAFGLASPALQRFFQGRSLDSEARRLLALARYAQNRAVTEGIPMVVWLDAQQGRYGLEAASGYEEPDPHALEYALQDNLQLEVGAPPSVIRAGLGTLGIVNTALPTEAGAGLRIVQRARLPALRMLPDGLIAASSPEYLVLKDVRNEQELDRVWLAQNTNRLAYELRTTPPQTTRR